MFHFLASDVLRKKRQTREREKEKKEEKKQVFNKSGSLHLMQIVPQDSYICVYHTHAAHTVMITIDNNVSMDYIF